MDMTEVNVIKPLPESARNTIRSGVILFDVARVIEELVYNSLDAGASKIGVFVGVGFGYIKVVDDGYGVSRDGLVLLGERYVTSKPPNFSCEGAANECFGHRGETLASISDFSVIEISTKAVGKPNGYWKVIKGSKGVCIRIDDREDAGTTVVVRDLFYNQPVRRGCIQISPKKVLHSVKKCILRIALVHPQVSFNVYDLESDDELLQINSLSTAFSLLMVDSGIEIASPLHRVDAKDGTKALSGYISKPKENFNIKVPQYVYINSRFINKCPIHKLLAHMACSFEYLDPSKAHNWNHRGKRHRHQAIATYILNLICPHALYEISFEASKVHVEFKDWRPVFTFIENVVQSVWSKNQTVESTGEKSSRILHDEIQEGNNHEAINKGIIQYTRKRYKSQKSQTSACFVSPLHESSCEGRYVLLQGRERFPVLKFKKEILKQNTIKTGEEFIHQSDDSQDFWQQDIERFPVMELNKEAKKLFQCKAENEFFHQTDHGQYFLDIATQKYDDPDQWEFSTAFSKCRNLESYSPQIDHNSRNFSIQDALYLNDKRVFQSSCRKPLLCGCNSQEPFDGAITRQGAFKVSNDMFSVRETENFPGGSPDILKYSGKTEASFDCSPMSWGHNEGCPAHPQSGFSADMRMAASCRSPGNGVSIATYENQLNEEVFDSAMAMRNIDPSQLQSTSNWLCPSRGPFPTTTYLDFGKSICNSMLAVGKKTEHTLDSGYFAYEEEDNNIFTIDSASRSPSRKAGISGCLDNFFDLKYNFNICEDLSRILGKSHSYNKVSEGNAWHTDQMGQKQRHVLQHSLQNSVCGCRPRRSHSAPPFYQPPVNHCVWRKLEKSKALHVNHDSFGRARDLKDLNESPDVSWESMKPTFVGISGVKQITNSKQQSALDKKADSKNLESSLSQLRENVATEGDVSKESGFQLHSMCKWRSRHPLDTGGKQSCDVQNQDVLDISTGILQNLGGDTLVPESLHRNFLEGTKVLQQVDKKFIPVVAHGILAVVDQHAADERIRLEELRQEVLAGKGRTISHLNSEQELILPEMGNQLLLNYSDQIISWGWICASDIQESSNSFKKSMGILQRPRNRIMLKAVPCILGVKLSDADLLEFLQQLVDTDGSSTIPPSVLRVLNCKACRGAIMFGDTLLPSECSLIVEELKKTSLCFQCAHGRPTTVPLVNLKALHAQISKLSCSKPWRAQNRRPVSLERARRRLLAANP